MKINKHIIFYFSFTFLPLCLSGQGQPPSFTPRQTPAMGAVPEPPEDPLCIFGTGVSGKLDARKFEKIIAQADVVYVGESHDQMNDHIAQLAALKALHKARGEKIIVGFEMLNVTFQPVLDGYVLGKISEKEFLEKSNWKKGTGFDFNLYKPIFNFIKEKKLKAAALNVPRKIILKIARTGVDSLDAEEKKFLPEKIMINGDTNYMGYLNRSYNEHSGNSKSSMIKWDNYFASMAAWNEGMAWKAAQFLEKNKGHAMLVVAGNGHVVYNAGVPWSLKARNENLSHASFYTEGVGVCPKTFPPALLEYADFVWFVKHEVKKPEGQMQAPAGQKQPAPTSKQNRD
ncbi:MAG: ChaN family lipoprotein [Elusimicrobia bacterium]|nr:ChaN family lipoprotein [Elusimicrobiota bacterium]